MSSLKEAPFYLKQGDQINIRVFALNLVGWSNPSDVSSNLGRSAILVDVPHKPNYSPQRDDI